MSEQKIIQGDCLEVMKTFPDSYIDLTVTSPPYGAIRDYNGFSFDFEGIVRELWRIMKDGGVVVWNENDQVIDGSESGESFRHALFFKEVGFNLHDTMIYDKGSVVFPDANRYHNSFEYMFVFSKGKPKTFNPIKDRRNATTRVNKKNTYRQKDGTLQEKVATDSEEFGWRFNIWRINAGFMISTPDKSAYEHPATFPEALPRDHIISWSNPNDIVLDPFNGSGTTTKMAKHLGRQFIGIDISEKYCEIARKRLEQDLLF